MAIQPGTQIGPDGRRHPITQPAPAAVVAEPQDDPGQDDPGQDDPGQDGTAGTVAVYEVNVVPTGANDVIEWIENADDADDAAARAYAAREAEESHKPPRSTVVAAIDKALAPS